ncbi:hypothetical protein OH492_20150 [Vibrio chagasii]|nr:hypothetical protein [Vibrio chagasii]
MLSGFELWWMKATFIALEHPKRFGALSQSGSFWWQPKTAKSIASDEQSWMSELRYRR